MPTARKEQKIQIIPTETQPVKKDLEKMYREANMGIGHSTKRDTVLC